VDGFISAVMPYWLAGGLTIAPITRTPNSRTLVIGEADRTVDVDAPARTIYVMED
jgi:hypothetical protein